MTDVESAKFNPASVFGSPKEVLRDNSISKVDKISILQHWADDERERLVAEEENMRRSEEESDYQLDEIQKALEALGVSYSGSDTKHG